MTLRQLFQPVDGDVFRMSEAADAAEVAAARVARKETNKIPCCRGACQDRCLRCSEKCCRCLHLRMTRPIRTKLRATTTVMTTMMTQLYVDVDGETDQVQGVLTQMALCK